MSGFKTTLSHSEFLTTSSNFKTIKYKRHIYQITKQLRVSIRIVNLT